MYKYKQELSAVYAIAYPLQKIYMPCPWIGPGREIYAHNHTHTYQAPIHGASLSPDPKKKLFRHLRRW